MGALFNAGLQRPSEASEPVPFCIFVDEFQNFVTDTVAQMLSESWKFGLSLTLAN